MQALRPIFAAVMTCGLAAIPVCAGPTSALGTIVAADKAHVGEAAAEVGTTVFGGDRLSTETQGSVQLRAGAARLLLLGSSSAVVNDDTGTTSAKLLAGKATFSTGNAHAFTLYASTAIVHAATDAPTIGQVAFLSANELVVTASRGSLEVNVADETQTIPEGTSYRVLLDPQEPAGAGSKTGGGGGGSGRGGPPLKAGRSRFLIITLTATGIVTYFFVAEALESPARP